MKILKQTKDYEKMDEISFMKVGSKYVYIIINWIDGTEKFKITRNKMEEYLKKYDFENNKFYAVFTHAFYTKSF